MELSINLDNNCSKNSARKINTILEQNWLTKHTAYSRAYIAMFNNI